MHIYESTHTPQQPISWRRKARAEAPQVQVRQGRVREGEKADEKMGAHLHARRAF